MTRCIAFRMIFRAVIGFARSAQCLLLFAATLIFALPAEVPVNAATAPKPPSAAPYRKVVEGFYVRPVNETAMPGGRYRLRVWAAIAGPARRTRPIAFPGGAALIVQSGEGEALTRNTRAALRLGGTLSLNAGDAVAFVNRRSQPIKLRVVIVEVM